MRLKLQVICAFIIFLPFKTFSQTSQRIFFIEKSQSPNIICYDAFVTKEGKFRAKYGVDGYWWSTTKNYRYEFNWIETWIAYGFDTETDLVNNIIMLKMRALKKRPVKIIMIDGKATGQMKIDNKWSKLDKIYIKVAKHLYPPLEYIELIGTEISSGNAVIERIRP